MSAALLLTVCLAAWPGAAPAGVAPVRAGKIRGRVIDARTHLPIAGVSVLIEGTSFGSTTDSTGTFALAGISPDGCHLRLTCVGYTSTTRLIDVVPGQTVTTEISLSPVAIPLRGVTVTPSRYSIGTEAIFSSRNLTWREIDAVPQIGEDVYRAITRLPGVTTNDFSARFAVRGGGHDEVLVLLDGLELHDPFHLQDVDGGALSIIDANSIGCVSLMTGAFPAEYSNRLSGVFDMQTRRPAPGRKRHSLGVSFVNARATSEGTFDGDRGRWLISARRGYVDLILELMGEDTTVSPAYYDLLTKVGYQVSKRHHLSLSLLHADDNLMYVEDDLDSALTGYGNTYFWLTAHSQLGKAVSVRTLASVGHISHDRHAVAHTDRSGRFQFAVDDYRWLRVLSLKQDWNLDITERWYFKTGAEVKTLNAQYDYSGAKMSYYPGSLQGYDPQVDTVHVAMEPTGTAFGAYAATRWRLGPSLTVEAGLRYDHNSYAKDRLFSPRINLSYDIGSRTSLRCGWGYFRQSQGLHRMEVQDGEDKFWPAERAEHYVIGLEHQFDSSTVARVEVYRKELSQLRPEYRNLTNPLDPFAEAQDDRVTVLRSGATSKGMELSFRRGWGKFTWWASYALASATDDVAAILRHDMVLWNDLVLPGAFDQRHTVYLDVGYAPNPHWQLNLAWQFHSGWRHSEWTALEHQAWPTSEYVVVLDSPYTHSYPDYHRLDFRIKRQLVTAAGRLAVYLEVVNLLNRDNVRNYLYDWSCISRRCAVAKTAQYWFHLLPSIGIVWSFGT